MFLKHEFLSYINNLLYEVVQKDEYYEEICENLFQALIFNMKRRTKSNLDHLASITHMNKYYLIHIFKKFVGTTPIDYLIERRTSMSKMLLETTEYSIDQISQIVGFTSQSYFNQIFKKRVG